LDLFKTPLGQEAEMDDDLRALLDSMDDDEEEDDLLGAFADPTGGATEDDLTLPDWMEAGLAEQPTPSPPPATIPGHLTDVGDDSPDWLAAATTPDAETLPDTLPAPEAEPSPEPEPSTPTEPGGRPEWLAELDPGLGPLPEDDLVDEPAPRSRRRRAAPSGKPRALTPQQRMLLSIFLFLDIAVLGCFLLLAIGAISF
jgi:hypothetical protein